MTYFHAANTAPGNGPFLPDKYFLGLLQRAVAEKLPKALFSHPTLGWIAVIPAENQWHSHIADLRTWCCTPAEEFRLGGIPAHLDLSQLRPQRLEDLLWQAALHAGQGRLYQDCTLHDVVQLKHWPNLAHLPHTPDFVRLCALLSRRQHSLDEACRLLGVAESEACAFYGAAQASGALQLVHRPSTPPATNHFEPEPHHVNQRSLTLRSLWRRLTGRH